MRDPIEEELDAAMAKLGEHHGFSKAVLEGLAIRRPALSTRLSKAVRIATDRLAAAKDGQVELTDNEIDRIEKAAGLSALELAWATMGSDGSALGELAAQIVKADGKRIRSRGTAGMKKVKASRPRGSVGQAV